MFEQLILTHPDFINAPVSIQGQITACSHRLGDNNSVILEAKAALSRYGKPNAIITKTDLLGIWKDDSISFAARCLITIWWGGPNYQVMGKIYSESNIEKLNNPLLEKAYCSLYKENDFAVFKTGLEELFSKSRNGVFHLDGIGVSFFTKFFHFYFASHPPKSNTKYLPVIADDIMRMAVFAEMIDKGEDVAEVFYTRDASLRTYIGYADRFNAFAIEQNLSPFILEDIIFNYSKGIGRAYLAGYNGRFYLPHWIAGRYNADEQIAIVFNNLMAETYLFEGPTAQLWDELLKTEYEERIETTILCERVKCSRYDLYSFFKELIDKRIITDHSLSIKELDKVKRSVNRSKRAFLRSSKGVGDFHSSYDSVDNDYRNRVIGHGIPFSATVELTYSCNEACVHCYNPNSPREGGIGTQKPIPKGEMQIEDYFRLLDAMKQLGVVKIVFTGGDPFMKKGLLEILQYAHNHKFTFSVYTNGQALYANRRLYDKLKEIYPQYIGLSIYSTIPEVHDSITRRKGSCEKTMTVAEWCYHDAIGLQIKCPIMQANMNSYDGVFKYAMRINGIPQFDVNITSSVDGDCFASRNLRLNEEQLKKILKDPRIPLSIENSVGVIERNPDMTFCGAGDANFNIKPDGTVTPCSAFHLDCGNLKEETLGTIWKESTNLQVVRRLRYKDSDLCGKEVFCKYCNRCIGQSFVEHGSPENHSEDNCFLAKIRCELAKKQEKLRS